MVLKFRYYVCIDMRLRGLFVRISAVQVIPEPFRYFVAVRVGFVQTTLSSANTAPVSCQYLAAFCIELLLCPSPAGIYWPDRSVRCWKWTWR